MTQRLWQSRRVAQESPAAAEHVQRQEHRPQPRSSQQSSEPLTTRSHRLARRKGWAALSSRCLVFVGDRWSVVGPRRTESWRLCLWKGEGQGGGRRAVM